LTRASSASVDGALLAKSVKREFAVEVPQALVSFWDEVGVGAFGRGELFFFGDDDTAEYRDSLSAWNKHELWGELLPAPADGGPFFFAETCFGMQVGFRYDAGRPFGYLLDIDTMRAFTIGESLEVVFSEVLVARDAFTDLDLLKRVEAKLGLLPKGMHYAPIVSPLIGGTLTVDNYHLETPNVHLRTSAATFVALHEGS